MRAIARWWSERREAGVLEETHDSDQIIQRVAALEVGKAELTCRAIAYFNSERPSKRLYSDFRPL
jgi:hypothetical protein